MTDVRVYIPTLASAESGGLASLDEDGTVGGTGGSALNASAVEAVLPDVVNDASGTGTADWAVVKEAPLNAEWAAYGASRSASDNTSAIQDAINALPQSATLGYGGTIFLPNSYKCASQLDLDSLVGVRFLGHGHQGGYSNVNRSGLVHTGTGSGPNNSFLSCRSAQSCAFENLSIRYTNASYAGTLIDFSHASSEIDAQNNLIADCHVGGDYTAGVYGAHCLVSFDNAVINTIRYSYLQFAERGVVGAASDESYSNAIALDHCTFDNFTVAAICNAVERWTVTAGVFEGTNGLGVEGDGGSALYRAYYDEAGTSGRITFLGGWIGDAVYVSNWIDAQNGGSVVLVGMDVQGGNCCFNVSGGGTHSSVGSFLSNTATGIFDYGTTNSANLGGLIAGNILHPSSIDTPAFTGLDLTRRVVVIGNADNTGIGSSNADAAPIDHLPVDRPIILADFPDSVPSATLGAGAGGSPSGGLSYGAADNVGQIEITTGSDPTTSTIITVTYGIVIANTKGDAPYNPEPTVIFSPSNAAAAKAEVYQTYTYDGTNWTGFELVAATALTADTAYSWNYTVFS